MAGDYSRIPGGIHRRFSSVLMQQGRVHLDSDWNDLALISARRWTTQADDTFGPAAVPRATTPQGFSVSAAGTTPADLLLGSGRCYVDGLQAELFVGETLNGKPVSYLNQPYLPNPPAITASGVAYLDVWQREVTPFEDPNLLDPALGGVDTTTRMQTVWQVKLLTADPTSSNPVSCATNLNAIFPPSAGRITTAANAPVAATDPCILPDQGGYRGIENRLYRVQIHTGGNAATARWKWSRENASVVARVLQIATSGQSTLTVDRTGRDAALRFSANDWVEITDHVLELNGQPGVMAKIVGQPNDAAGTVLLDRALPATFNAADPTRHTRLIRWDQQTGVDANGLLPITSAAVELEDGVIVTLAIDTTHANGVFNSGDWWAFAARTATASVEVMTAAPPFGTLHHYCTLATIAVSGATISVTGDCRVLWPPQTGTGTDCCCTVCVTADGHNSGQATIAMALQTIGGKGGGRVCLGPGLFGLQAPISVSGLTDVIISGQGAATALVNAAGGATLSVDATFGLRIEDLSIFATSPAPTFAPTAAPIGILLRNSVDVTVQRCGIVALAPPAQAANTLATVGGAASGAAAAASSAPIPAGAAIALDGFIIEARIAENDLVAGIGIAKAGLLGTSTDSGTGFRALMLLGGLRVHDNWILCSTAGVALGDTSTRTGYSAYGLRNTIAGNFVLGSVTGGIGVQGYSAVGAAMQVAGNHLEVGGPGITVALDGCTVADNHVTQLDAAAALSAATHAAGAAPTPGIVINPVAGALAIGEARVLCNRIFGIGGPGIAINAPVLALAVIDNAIASTQGAGIVTGAAGQLTNAIVRGNEVFAVGSPISPDAGVVAGIDIANAGSAVIQNNVIDAIAATGTAAATAGIQLRKVARAAVAGNDIADVGQAGDLANLADGIIATAPDGAGADLRVNGNNIRQSGTAQTNAGRFSAISVAAQTAVQASITGNVVEGASVLPLINFVSTGACVLSDNRCTSDGTATLPGAVGALSPVVLVQAGTVIAGNNRISTAAGQIGLVVTVPVNANKQPDATVLGNFVGVGIQLNSAPLAAPWAPLNVIV